MTPTRREYFAITIIALVFASLIAMALPGPTYTDAYYYFNAGKRLAGGEGLTDPYIALTYLDAPESLPGASHIYWMPLTSLLVAWAGGSFALAQVIFVVMWAALAVLAFWLGAFLGKTRRHAWAAGLLTVFCGFYAMRLVTTDNFLSFGLAGALCLLMIGLGRRRGDWRAFAAAGALAGLAHLSRADGLLLLAVLGLMALWPARDAKNRWRARSLWVVMGLAAYLLVMAPWFMRNMDVVGSPLPTSGSSTIWLRGYDEIASYPPDISPDNFFAWGWDNIIQSRLTALGINAGRFFLEQGIVVLGPFILIALWKRRRDPFLMPVWIYALALHLLMTFVFAYPGYRGSLFHSATALLPWWAAVGILGLDDAIDWIAVRRRRWRPTTAKNVFTVEAVIAAIVLTLLVALPGLQNSGTLPPVVRVAQEVLPDDAVVMSNLPPAVYYHTGFFGVPVPNAGPEAIQQIAQQYDVTHVLLDENRTEPLADLYEGRTLPAFLRLVEQEIDDSVRVFEVLP